MAAWGILLICLQAAFITITYSQSLPCNGNTPNMNVAPPNTPCNSGANTAANIGRILTAEAPMKITSATFTPINAALASQAGLPQATVSEVVPNLQFGDVSITGDLPIGGTIKVSGCFPVYGMVGVDGVVPSSGTAVANSGCQFPAQLQQIPQNTKPFKAIKPCAR